MEKLSWLADWHLVAPNQKLSGKEGIKRDSTRTGTKDDPNELPGKTS